MPRTLDLPWWALAAASCAAGVAASVAVARAAPLTDAFEDGRSYRRMARGHPGTPPFQRRVLGPALARGLGGDGPGAFRRVSLPALAASGLAVGALTCRVAACAGAPAGRAVAAGVAAAGLVPAMPHGARLAVQVPEFNDPLAGALGCGWLLLATAPGPRARRLAPAAALVATLAREQWGVVIPVALAVTRPGRGAAVAHVAAVAGAAAVVGTRPAAGGSEVWSPAQALRRLASVRGLGEALWAATFVPGALLAGVPAAAGAAVRPGAPAVLRACLVTAAAQAGLGHVGGTDLPRLDAGALLPLLPAVLGTAAARGTAARPALALAATVPAWRPLTPLRPTREGYEAFYLPYMHPPLRPRLTGDVGRRAAGLGAAAALLLAARRHRPVLA